MKLTLKERRALAGLIEAGQIADAKAETIRRFIEKLARGVRSLVRSASAALGR